MESPQIPSDERPRGERAWSLRKRPQRDPIWALASVQPALLKMAGPDFVVPSGSGPAAGPDPRRHHDTATAKGASCTALFVHLRARVRPTPVRCSDAPTRPTGAPGGPLGRMSAKSGPVASESGGCSKLWQRLGRSSVEFGVWARLLVRPMFTIFTCVYSHGGRYSSPLSFDEVFGLSCSPTLVAGGGGCQVSPRGRICALGPKSTNFWAMLANVGATSTNSWRIWSGLAPCASSTKHQAPAHMRGGPRTQSSSTSARRKFSSQRTTSPGGPAATTSPSPRR